MDLILQTSPKCVNFMEIKLGTFNHISWIVQLILKSALLQVMACRLPSAIAGTWWRHQMEKFSALLALCAGNSPVTGEFPAQRPVTRSFDVFFDLRLNKQSWGWWFETLSRSLWRHCNGYEKSLRLIWIKHYIKLSIPHQQWCRSQCFCPKICITDDNLL